MKAASLRTPVKVSFFLGAVLCVSLVTILVRSRLAPEPLVLRFLHYTNSPARVRIALMEITNRSSSPYRWTLRSDAQSAETAVWITDVVETNGALRGVGMSGGVNLFEHDALQFGTDDFRQGKRLWVEVDHYPKTRSEQFRERLSDRLWRAGLLRAALYVRRGHRINGPVLPADELR
jgi:hypothetical protein